MNIVNIENEAKLTQTRLKEVLHYDPATGLFTRLVKTTNSANVGAVAGTRLTTGYISVGVVGCNYQAHRLAFLYVHGRWPKPGLAVDHINGVTDDNRMCNLRELTQTANCLSAALRKDNTTGYPGVSWHKKTECFIARLQLDGKRLDLGQPKTPERAHLHYKAALIIHNFSITHGLTHADASIKLARTTNQIKLEEASFREEVYSEIELLLVELETGAGGLTQGAKVLKKIKHLMDVIAKAYRDSDIAKVNAIGKRISPYKPLEVPVPELNDYMDIIMTKAGNTGLRITTSNHVTALIKRDRDYKSISDMASGKYKNYNPAEADKLVLLAKQFIANYHETLKKIGLTKDHDMKMLGPDIHSKGITLRFERN